MSVVVEVFDALGLTISESKTKSMCMLIPRVPATPIVFNATGQQHRLTTSFAYFARRRHCETPNLSAEIADPCGVDELEASHAEAV